MIQATRARDQVRDVMPSGADGNERLTALAGAALFALLAVEGVTVAFLQPLLPVHFFVGMLLIGPLTVKVGSTVYRFVRYYAGAPDYRRKGPPAVALRLLGPFVIVTSLAVAGTGVGLAFTTPQHGLLLMAHKASFVLWFMVMTVHVLAYIWRIPGLIAAELARARGRHATGDGRALRAGTPRIVPGRAARFLLLAVALAASLVIAMATLHLAAPWNALGGGG